MQDRTKLTKVGLHSSCYNFPFIHLILGTDHQLIAKIARENEVTPPAKISQLVGKVCILPKTGDSILIFSIMQAMQTARKEYSSSEKDQKGLSQKELAQKINEKPSIIQAYESGTAIPNPQILGKLERALKVKLRGGCLRHHDTEPS
jgi:hypothetical protein